MLVDVQACVYDFDSVRSEISRTLPSLDALQKVLDQPMSPGAGRLRSQVGLQPNQIQK